VSPDPNGPRARQLKLQQKRDEVARLRVLRDQVQQGELEVQRQADLDREEAHQQAKKLAAQTERARQLVEAKRIKKREADRKAKGDAKRGPEDGGEAFGWAPVTMRNDQGHTVYDQAGCVRYLPHNGPRDRPTKKNK
jgi:multidrug efflux pump subunit AcrA (membrane-fusion protein)